MLIFEQLVSRGFMALDADRKVLTFNREVVGEFPSIRKQKIQEAGLIASFARPSHARTTMSFTSSTKRNCPMAVGK